MAEELEVEAMAPEAKPRSAQSDALKGLYFGEVEQSFQESAYYPDSQKKPYNPDPLVEKDYTYGLYEEMLNDDQVDVAINLKKDLVIGSGWHIQCEEDDVKNELEEILCDEVERPLSEILQDILQAYEFGFSISEKLFKTLPDGRLALKDIKPRHPSTWLIHTDPHGNVTRYEQRAQRNSIDIDPKSIIHYVNNQRFQNPYGRSDLLSAYQAWLTKRHITRFYAIFLENAAGPKPVAKYDRKAPQSVVDDIFQAIKKFQTKTAMAIPKDFDIEFLEAKNSGEAYIKGINLFNMFIGRALFIPDLLGFSGGETGGGSFSLGKEQIGLFYKHIFRRREILERIIDQHVIRPMCIYNYGMMEKFPKFKFNPLSEDDAVKQAELWIKGVQGAGWQPTPEEVNHFRSLVKFPESDDVVMKSDIVAEQMGGKPGEGKEGAEGEAPPAEVEEKEDKKEYGGPGSGGAREGAGRPPGSGESMQSTMNKAKIVDNFRVDTGKRKLGAKEIEKTKDGFVMRFKDEKGDLLEKQGEPNEDATYFKNIKSVQSSSQAMANKLVPGAYKVTVVNDEKGWFSVYFDEINEKKEFALKLDSLPGDYKNKTDFKLADQTLKTAVAKLKAEAQPIIEDIFEDLYDQLQKKKIVQTQNLERADSIQLKYLSKLQNVFKKHFRMLHQDAMNQAKNEVKKSDFAAPLPNDEFLEFLNQETYKYIGDWSYEITKKTKNQLIKAIKDGKPLSSVISVLDNEGKALSDVSLERYARTKTTEVFNRGRMDYFESTGVVAAYQYSAIIDDVTSEICGELNGKIFEKDDAPIPPLHFNCRSLLIPITRFEEYKVDTKTESGKNIDSFIEKNVEDKGFSRFNNTETPEVEPGSVNPEQIN